MSDLKNTRGLKNKAPSSSRGKLSVRKLVGEMKALRMKNPIKVPRFKQSISRAQPQKQVASAYSSGLSTGSAKVVRAQDGSIRVTHRELVLSVTGTTAFAVAKSFPINPGMPQSFPWLSNLAQNYQFYRFNKLKYCYYTRTGSNVPGSVMLVPDYDAADASPTNEVIASSYKDVQEDAPWKDIDCPLSSQDLNMTEKDKYIRSGSLAVNQDIKTYDSGNMFICTIDGTAVNWGKLWVEYDVTLRVPQTPSSGFGGNGIIVGGGAFSQTAMFGTTPVSTGAYGMTVNGNVVSLFGLNIGAEYLVSFTEIGTVISAGPAVTITSGTQVTALYSGFPVAATSGALVFTFTANAAGVLLTFTTTATTITSSSLSVSQTNPTPSI